MKSMTKAFTVTETASNDFVLKPGETAAYQVSGTFTGICALERAAGFGAWAPVDATVADTPKFAKVTNDTRENQRYRFRMSGTVTGTANATIRVADAEPEVGDTPSSSIAVQQRGSVVKQTVLTLAGLAVTVANTTGASFGSAQLYDFPAGRILVLGVTADLAFDWKGEDIDAAGSGDFSIGSSATADATLGGTDVNLLPSTAMTDPFVEGAGVGSGALAASAHFDGTSTALDAYLNLIIDDADVADAASDVVKVSGTVTITWVNLGDY